MSFRASATYGVFKSPGSLRPTFDRIHQQLQGLFPEYSVVSVPEDLGVYRVGDAAVSHHRSQGRTVYHDVGRAIWVLEVVRNTYYIEAGDDAIFEVLEKWKEVHSDLYLTISITETVANSFLGLNKTQIEQGVSE